MRKGFIVILAIAFVVVGLGMAQAAQNVGNNTQKGSLLIFPKIDVSDGRDTIVEINNDFYKAVTVKCYWVNLYQQIEDFEFVLTRNQPIWFSAKFGLSLESPILGLTDPVTVPPFDGPVGELKCWAVDPPGLNQISFNHLYGSATIFDPVIGQAWEYNSWNFTARQTQEFTIIGTGGQILLDGANNYDACPQYLVGDFIAAGGGMFTAAGLLTNLGTDLTVVPCKQDLRQDRKPTFTKLKFDVWNENEVKYTGAYQCIKCWFEGFLHQIGVNTMLKGFGADKFTFPSLKTAKGRVRIMGVPSTVCGTPTVATPLIGVASKHWLLEPADTSLEDSFPVAGSNLNSAGADPTGFILYDPQAPVVQGVK